jgi:hypothetical protein
MNKLKLTILVLISILGVASVNAQDKSSVAITLERTACFGTCPIYTISIFDNGDVIYKGDKFVDVVGEQTSQIDPETVKAMVAAFEKPGYFDWKEAYDTQTVTDLPTIITSVTRNGQTHKITRYAGDSSAPLALPFLEQWIDTMTNSSLWTGKASDLTNVSNGTDTPLITLERGACFGFCPIYTVALFADGTIVKTGIANVKDLGVQILKVDATEINSVIQRAQALGYFDWQDSYDKQVMTDQVTVISSIRLDDQFKRVVRYNGDPNAPVGLTWIEDSIDQVVTNAAG